VTTLNEVVVTSSNPPSPLLCEHVKKKKKKKTSVWSWEIKGVFCPLIRRCHISLEQANKMGIKHLIFIPFSHAGCSYPLSFFSFSFSHARHLLLPNSFSSLFPISFCRKRETEARRKERHGCGSGGSWLWVIFSSASQTPKPPFSGL
jgi:hypothetical protein